MTQSIAILSLVVIAIIAYWIADKSLSGIITATILLAIALPIVWKIEMFIMKYEILNTAVTIYAKYFTIVLGGGAILILFLILVSFVIKSFTGQKDFGSGL